MIFAFFFLSILPFHDMKSEVTSFRKKSLAWIDPDLQTARQGFFVCIHVLRHALRIWVSDARVPGALLVTAAPESESVSLIN